MIRVSGRVEHADDVTVSLTVAMPLSSWETLRCILGEVREARTHPVWELRHAIEKVMGMIRATVAENIET